MATCELVVMVELTLTHEEAGALLWVLGRLCSDPALDRVFAALDAVGVDELPAVRGDGVFAKVAG